jgi:hypothetical protein
MKGFIMEFLHCLGRKKIFGLSHYKYSIAPSDPLNWMECHSWLLFSAAHGTHWRFFVKQLVSLLVPGCRLYLSAKKGLCLDIVVNIKGPWRSVKAG